MIILFDTETTGLLNPDSSPVEQQPRIIEFAGIKLNEQLEKVGELDFLIDPGIEVPEKITEITGLKTEDVKGKGSFITHLPKLQEFFLGTQELVAHNLPFDLGLLKYELIRCDSLLKFPWPPQHTCTVESTYHIKNFRLNLTRLHEHCFGTAFEGAHRGLADTEALMRCFVKLRKEGEI